MDYIVPSEKTCYSRFHPGEDDLGPLNKTDPPWHIFRNLGPFRSFFFPGNASPSSVGG